MTGDNLTILVALAAGVISFLSPCVLPLVPAYLGQLTAVAVADAARSGATAATVATASPETPATPSRWTALRHALAYVAGFGSVFTLLGVTATFAAAGLSPWMPVLRQVGGVLLVLLGLNLAGMLRIPSLTRNWRPLDAGASASVASATGTLSFGTPGGPGLGDRLGGRLVSSRGGWLASYGLGAIFAIGWTPCVGVILGGILGLASSSTTVGQGAILLVAYTVGLGLPFIAIAVAYDRAPGLLRPFLRHGRIVELVGGLLVVAIGLAMIFDLLARLAVLIPFNNQI